MHQYSYAGGNPQFFVDPLGLLVDPGPYRGLYERFKRCSNMFNEVARYFESWWRYSPPPHELRIRPVSEAPWSNELPGCWFFKNRIYVDPASESCERLLPCLFHEFYEQWLIREAGYPSTNSLEPAGAAHQAAAFAQNFVPTKQCCCDNPLESIP